MATQTAKGSGSTNNNGGTTINAGSADTVNGPISNNLQVKDLSVDDGYGSKVVEIAADDSDDFADTYGVIKARTAGDFAHNDQDNFIVRGAGTVRGGSINGSGTQLLNSPAAEFAGVPRGKENTVEGSTKLGNPQWVWPMLPGSGRNPGLVEGADTGDSYNFTNAVSQSAAADKVVSNNLSVPGQLTYRTGASNPQTTNFKARDSAEQ